MMEYFVINNTLFKCCLSTANEPVVAEVGEVQTADTTQTISVNYDGKI
jgi:hypothetical protein